MGITATEIGQIVATDDDLGHEIIVGELLHHYPGSETQEHGSYIDSYSRKTREFDYRWKFQSASTVASCAIECKNIHADAPLVLSGRKRTAIEAYHYLVESRRGLFRLPEGKGRGVIDTRSSHVIREVRGEDSIYAPDEFVGQAVIRIRSKGPADQSKQKTYVRSTDAEIYALWSQAIASAAGLIELARHYPADLNSGSIYTVILPLIVVPDGSLWKVERGKEQGGAQPVKTEECELYVGREITIDGDVADIGRKHVFSHVHFLTVAGLRSFLERVTGDESWRKRLFNERLIRIAESERAY